MLPGDGFPNLPLACTHARTHPEQSSLAPVVSLCLSRLEHHSLKPGSSKQQAGNNRSEAFSNRAGPIRQSNPPGDGAALAYHPSNPAPRSIVTSRCGTHIQPRPGPSRSARRPLYKPPSRLSPALIHPSTHSILPRQALLPPRAVVQHTCHARSDLQRRRPPAPVPNSSRSS